MPDDTMLSVARGAAVLDQLIASSKARTNGETQPTHKNVAVGNCEVRLAFRRLSDVEAKPIHWLWRGRFARGKVSIIAGHPGLGKSQITASMAAIVTTGGRWPVDRTTCEPGSVIFLSAEDDAADTIRPRLEASGADVSRCYIVDAVRETGRQGEQLSRAFNLRTDLSRLSELLAELKGVVLIVIDPITAYMGETDSHKNAEVRALLAPVAEFAASHDVAVIGVSHLTKGGSNEALMRVTGSLAFVAASRAAFMVVKDQDNPTRRLFLPAKNNLGKDETGYAFTVESFALPDGIETSRVSWEAVTVTITADEAMAPVESPEDRSEILEAADWLRDVLIAGQVEAASIKRQAVTQGFNWRTVQRARERIGATTAREGFGKGSRVLWALPIDDKSTIDDRQKR